LPVRGLMLRRESAGERLTRQKGRGGRVELALRSREHQADAAAARAKVALQPAHRVTRAWLDDVAPARGRRRTALLAGHRGERGERRVRAKSRGELPGAEDRGLGGRVRVSEVVGERRTPADA